MRMMDSCMKKDAQTQTEGQKRCFSLCVQGRLCLSDLICVMKIYLGADKDGVS